MKPASGTLEVPRRMAGKTLEAPKRHGLPRSIMPPAPVRPYERHETRGETRSEQQAVRDALGAGGAGRSSAAPTTVIIDAVTPPKTSPKTPAKIQPRDSERQRHHRAQVERQRQLRAAQSDRRAPQAASPGPQPRVHQGTPRPPLSPDIYPSNSARRDQGVARTGELDLRSVKGEPWMEQLVERIREQDQARSKSGGLSGANKDGGFGIVIAVLIGLPLLILWAFVGSSALFFMGILLWIGSNKVYEFTSGTTESALLARQQLVRISPSWSNPDTARLHMRILAGMCVVACVVLQWDVIFG